MNEQDQILKKPHKYEEQDHEYVAVPYHHQHFPKWKYHPTKPEVLVKTAEEERNLGPGWTDRRIIAEHPPKSSEELLRENEELKKQLAALKKA